MSEVQTRGSTRGRGGFRGGRGGYRGSRGGKSHTTKSDEQENVPSLEEQGEVGELKAKYADKLPLMREVCEGWSDEDLVFALQETNGDEVTAMDRITSGTISQWGEVKKKQPKAKDAIAAADSSSRGRGRGGFEARGRGRGADRGDRGDRGGRVARGARTVSQANGTKPVEKAAKAADDGLADSTAATNGDAAAAAAGEWANEPGKDKLESLETDKPQPAAAAAPTSKAGGWASLFAKPVSAPAPVSKAEPTPPQLPAVEEPAAPAPPATDLEEALPTTAPEEPADEPHPAPPPIEEIAVDEGPSELPSAPHSDIAPNDLAPAADELTKENVNKLPDTSNHMASLTVASTTASTHDPLNPALPQVQAIRPGMSGHAASALRATVGAGRSSSYSRKVMEQQEAVVMPGNHAVDRAAVQFGKMGLDSDDMDADEDREEPETRTQLPDDSPAAPRASLPPAAAEPQKAPEPTPAEPPTEPQAQRPPSGLPSAPQQISEISPQQPSTYPDQYRYPQGQKPYDPFSQQPQQSQAPSEAFTGQLPSQSQGLPSTSQQEAYQHYYGREYGQYYGGYGQGQENQRSGSAFGTSAQDAQAQYATAGGPRGYGSQDMAASGNNTPNPHVAGHQNQHSGHMQQGPNAHTAYPYGQYGGNYGSAYPQYGSYGSMNHNNHRYGANRPMFDDARRQQDDYYNSQYGYAHNQGYSSSYGKSGMYGGPQHQYSHDYSSSPGNAAFAGREAYGRAGSTQPNDASQSNSTGSNAFAGGMPDPFGRTPSGFGQSQHGTHGAGEDPAKPTGPSPSLQGNRPGSAANTMGGQQQSGLPHPQSGQQAFGAGYSQYGGFGNQNNQHSSYGGYGSNNAFAGYGAAYGRGWAGQYGSGQH
ncbi:RNAPII degradation factor [Neophaeococcomyces mojaviensis]|uniref:RNAPII degradation factor n=1 Tax=Neophaeococcomyces mojaviensis TaxID=3383035 RepID=A0ACC3A543_9EURO|nr:RNAPII degradation factor [Knufia sp. JES_112]